MSDLLLDVPESTPKWRELAERHGIVSRLTEPFSTEVETWTAVYSEDGGIYARIERPTEREAVITLIHRLKLDGWQEVSL